MATRAHANPAACRSASEIRRAGNWLLAPCLAIVVVLGTAAAGSGDYMLVMPENGIATGSPAKSEETCELARLAAWRGWLPGVPEGTPSRCEPHPGAFDARSNFIDGFNMPAELRR